MRTSKIVSITVPSEMLSRAIALSKKENRTIRELVREALRQYERHRWWEETDAYARARAKTRGIREADVDRVIYGYRREKRAGRKRAPNLCASLCAQSKPSPIPPRLLAASPSEHRCYRLSAPIHTPPR